MSRHGRTFAGNTQLSLLALLGANVISQIGNALTFIAIPWFVLTTTGSASQTGITVAAGAFPVTVAGIFGGAVSFEPINPLMMAITQERVPAGFRARVFGARLALGAGTPPLGVLAYRALMDKVDLFQALIIFASLNTLLPLVMLVLPGSRSMPRPGSAASAGVALPLRGERAE
ncbi:MAG: hypothetical protein U0Z70_12585 [Thermomicrobiales bacterium]